MPPTKKTTRSKTAGTTMRAEGSRRWRVLGEEPPDPSLLPPRRALPGRQTPSCKRDRKSTGQFVVRDLDRLVTTRAIDDRHPVAPRNDRKALPPGLRMYCQDTRLAADWNRLARWRRLNGSPRRKPCYGSSEREPVPSSWRSGSRAKMMAIRAGLRSGSPSRRTRTFGRCRNTP